MFAVIIFTIMLSFQKNSLKFVAMFEMHRTLIISEYGRNENWKMLQAIAFLLHKEPFYISCLTKKTLRIRKSFSSFAQKLFLSGETSLLMLILPDKPFEEMTVTTFCWSYLENFASIPFQLWVLSRLDTHSIKVRVIIFPITGCLESTRESMIRVVLNAHILCKYCSWLWSIPGSISLRSFVWCQCNTVFRSDHADYSSESKCQYFVWRKRKPYSEIFSVVYLKRRIVSSVVLTLACTTGADILRFCLGFNISKADYTRKILFPVFMQALYRYWHCKCNSFVH